MFAVAKWLKSARAFSQKFAYQTLISDKRDKSDRKRRFRRLEVELLESRILLRGGGFPTDTWISTSSGNWNVAANWSTGVVPGPGDVAFIETNSALTVTIPSGDAEAVSGLVTDSNDLLSITGGSLTIAGVSVPSALGGGLSITGGSFTASGVGTTVTVANPAIASGASLFATGGATLNLFGTWTNNGTISVDSSSAIGLGDAFSGSPKSSGAVNYVWTNAGVVAIANGATVSFGGVFTTDDFDGIAQQPGVSLAQDNVTVVGTLDNSPADNPVSNGVLTLDASTGPLNLSGGEIYQGVVDPTGVDNLSFTGPGVNVLDGVTINGPLNIDGNCTVLDSGDRFVNGDLDVGDNSVLTLDASSTVSVSGNFTETSSATLNEAIAGAPAGGDFGRIAVAASATLAGAFNSTENGFTPSSTSDFPVSCHVCWAASGASSSVAVPSYFTSTLNSASFDLIAQPPPALYRRWRFLRPPLGQSYSCISPVPAHK